MMSAPFTEDDIGHWRNAKKHCQGVFTNMASVEEACRAVQVACFHDDRSPTVTSLAFKLLDACIFEYPGVSKKDTFNLCTESAHIMKAVFSSSRIRDSTRMARLIQTVYESLGANVPWTDLAPLFHGPTLPSPMYPEVYINGYVQWILLQLHPSNFSDDYGIKTGDKRGLAGHADVQRKWEDLVASSKGFSAERDAFLEGVSKIDRERSQAELRQVEAMTSWDTAHPSEWDDNEWLQRLDVVDFINAYTQPSAPLAVRKRAAFAFNVSILAPIMDAQLAVGPNEGVLMAICSAPDLSQEIVDLGKVVLSVALLMNGDLRSLTNLKIAKACIGGVCEKQWRVHEDVQTLVLVG